MLVLTQLAVGAFVAGLLLPGGSERVDAAAGLVFGLVALGASVLHLGRPRYCFRAVIGLRHSWLSREIVAFGAFAALAALYAIHPTPTIGAAAAVTGVAGVGCSVMIYVVTRRPHWRARFVAPRFAVTTVLCGTAATLLTSPRSSSALSLVLSATVLFAVVGGAFLERRQFFR